MGGIGIWDWDGILANGRGFWQKGWDMGWNGIGDSPIPFNMDILKAVGGTELQKKFDD
ncbi:hypothetical protein RhiirA1_480444 [Rhizophagus irregularis]|uniref:Uncharacterized protein n=1 Tax=Rhizophagus irregularis TaxID=588596 RepID=A0A2N0QPC5_9GLOM|nr:hypothetical protein RhiirA1_480444 [Rhizophagus irregularis]